MTSLSILLPAVFLEAGSFFFPESLIEDFLSNTKYKIYDSVFEIIRDELFMVRNTVKTGQSLWSAVTCRK